MITPTIPAADLIAAARTLLGTPFLHQGRVAGLGIDCIGTLIVAGSLCGIELPDQTGYSRSPHGVLQPAIEAHCGPAVRDPKPGYVGLFRVVDDPQHVALITDIGMLHAYASAVRVIEHPMDAIWQRRVVAYYRLPEIIYD